MAVHFTNTEELYGVQTDVLWERTTSNPKLVRRVNAVTNQQMNTKAERIISAINEIKDEAASATESVKQALINVNSLIGDVKIPEVREKLEAVGENVIEGLNALKTELDTVLDEAKAYTDSKSSQVQLDVIDGGMF